MSRLLVSHPVHRRATAGKGADDLNSTGQYQVEVQKIIQYGGSCQETSICNAFERLFNAYCKPPSYLLIPELDFKTKFNPPDNAWQKNFNQNNANRVYREIDKRIKVIYIKEGKAQNQIAVYDMYMRFYL